MNSNMMTDPLEEEVNDLLEAAGLYDPGCKYWVNTRQCSCGECKFHSPREAGWKVCPNASSDGFEKDAIWLSGTEGAAACIAEALEAEECIPCVLNERELDDDKPTVEQQMGSYVARTGINSKLPRHVTNQNEGSLVAFFDYSNRWFIVDEDYRPRLLKQGQKPSKELMEYQRAFSGIDVAKRLQAEGSNPRPREAWVALKLMLEESGRTYSGIARTGIDAAELGFAELERERYVKSGVTEVTDATQLQSH